MDIALEIRTVLVSSVSQLRKTFFWKVKKTWKLGFTFKWMAYTMHFCMYLVHARTSRAHTAIVSDSRWNEHFYFHLSKHAWVWRLTSLLCNRLGKMPATCLPWTRSDIFTEWVCVSASGLFLSPGVFVAFSIRYSMVCMFLDDFVLFGIYDAWTGTPVGQP